MTLLYDNWYVIIALACCIAVIIVYMLKFINLPTKSKLETFKQALCNLVQLAEAELGSGRGKEKLAFVYDEMVKVFPFIPVFMSGDTFSMLVNGALYEVGIWTKS